MTPYEEDDALTPSPGAVTAPGSAEPDACRLVRSGGASAAGKQGLDYAVGISAETVGARGLHMQLVTIPPGARAHAHKHVTHETAIYALSGTSAVWHGSALQHHTVVGPGDFLYIPADVPHLPYNPSATEAAVAVIARTDPNEQESVLLLPGLPIPEALRSMRAPPAPPGGPPGGLPGGAAAV